jgi:hypothetical protein
LEIVGLMQLRLLGIVLLNSVSSPYAKERKATPGEMNTKG